MLARTLVGHPEVERPVGHRRTEDLDGQKAERRRGREMQHQPLEPEVGLLGPKQACGRVDSCHGRPGRRRQQLFCRWPCCRAKCRRLPLPLELPRRAAAPHPRHLALPSSSSISANLEPIATLRMIRLLNLRRRRAHKFSRRRRHRPSSCCRLRHVLRLRRAEIHKTRSGLQWIRVPRRSCRRFGRRLWPRNGGRPRKRSHRSRLRLPLQQQVRFGRPLQKTAPIPGRPLRLRLLVLLLRVRC